MQDFLETVVRGMVQQPDAVRIEPVQGRGEIIYEVRVHPADMGRLVGRRGNTVNAIRTLLAVGAANKGMRCSLELIDEDEPGSEAQA
ncbi:MAG: KH domain-containing protein [Verrucomicrobiae bacterium]|nr:KH domain-containing protein [Verrucomicrobiae bacterium]